MSCISLAENVQAILLELLILGWVQTLNDIVDDLNGRPGDEGDQTDLREELFVHITRLEVTLE